MSGYINAQIVPQVVFGEDPIGSRWSRMLARFTLPFSPHTQGTQTRVWMGLAGYGLNGNRMTGAVPYAVQEFRGVGRAVSSPSSVSVGLSGGVSGGNGLPYTSMGNIDPSIALMSAD